MSSRHPVFLLNLWSGMDDDSVAGAHRVEEELDLLVGHGDAAERPVVVGAAAVNADVSAEPRVLRRNVFRLRRARDARELLLGDQAALDGELRMPRHRIGETEEAMKRGRAVLPG